LSEEAGKYSFAVLPSGPAPKVPSYSVFDGLPALPAEANRNIGSCLNNLIQVLAVQRKPAGIDKFISGIDRELKTRMEIHRTFRAGSSSVDTGIAGHSDVDMMVWLQANMASPDSEAVLHRVSAALSSAFGARMRVSSPAVIVGFDDELSVDVVPVIDSTEVLTGRLRGEAQLFLPGSSRDWIATNPEAHIKSIQNTDRKQYGRLRGLIRLLKAWKYFNQVPIVSYYLESFALHIARQERFSDFPQVEFFKILNCLWRFFQSGNVSIPDPNIYSNWGRLLPCERGDAQGVAGEIQSAAYLATRAMDAEWAGDLASAVSFWSQVVNLDLSGIAGIFLSIVTA